jgi:hypothetical protein
MLCAMATNTTPNPFKKTQGKTSQLTLTLQPDQKEIIEELGAHLGIKTNTGVALEALALLYDKYRSKLGKPSSTETETPTVK